MKQLPAALAFALLAWLALAPAVSRAQAANQYLPMLAPATEIFADCSKYGPAMRDRLKQAIEAARATTGDLLSAPAWDLFLRAANASKDNQKLPPVVEKICDSVIEQYRGPDFGNFLRRYIASVTIEGPAARCMVQQPSLAFQIMNAWLAAFSRNRLSISPETIESTVATLRPTIPREPRIASGQCESLISYLDSSNFDDSISLQWIKAMFGEPGK